MRLLVASPNGQLDSRCSVQTQLAALKPMTHGRVSDASF